MRMFFVGGMTSFFISFSATKTAHQKPTHLSGRGGTTGVRPAHPGAQVLRSAGKHHQGAICQVGAILVLTLVENPVFLAGQKREKIRERNKHFPQWKLHKFISLS